jgi:hypothetical protein
MASGDSHGAGRPQEFENTNSQTKDIICHHSLPALFNPDKGKAIFNAPGGLPGAV